MSNTMIDIKRERKKLSVATRVGCVLDLIEGELGDWQSVKPLYCPENMQVLKDAQERLQELYHELEVTNKKKQTDKNVNRPHKNKNDYEMGR